MTPVQTHRLLLQPRQGRHLSSLHPLRKTAQDKPLPRVHRPRQTPQRLLTDVPDQTCRPRPAHHPGTGILRLRHRPLLHQRIHKTGQRVGVRPLFLPSRQPGLQRLRTDRRSVTQPSQHHSVAVPHHRRHHPHHTPPQQRSQCIQYRNMFVRAQAQQYPRRPVPPQGLYQR